MQKKVQNQFENEGRAPKCRNCGNKLTEAEQLEYVLCSDCGPGSEFWSNLDAKQREELGQFDNEFRRF